MSGIRLVCVAALAAWANLPSLAQFTTANLSGTVADATGASVPQATVKVLNKETGFTRTDTTSADGAFTFPALPVGTYRLSAEKPGFSTYIQEGIILTVNRTATQRIVLQRNGHAGSHGGRKCGHGEHPNGDYRPVGEPKASNGVAS
jgi:hypothetical protein